MSDKDGSEKTSVSTESLSPEKATAEDEVSQNKLHMLKDRWFVSYIKVVTGNKVYTEDIRELDYVSSIEEAFATINTFPNPTLLPQNDNIVFARNKIEPKYEQFPDGVRLCIYTKSKSQTDEAVPRVLAAVLSEDATKEACEGNPVIDVLRVAHKPGQVYHDSVRIEVWAHACPYAEKLVRYFSSLLRCAPGVTVNTRGWKM